MARILFDIVHPADVLFFKRPIEELQARGDDVLILSRHKDVACDLLDEFGFAHTPITRAGTGKLGLGTELLMRDIRLLLHARRFGPDVLIGFGGVAVSHVGRLIRRPSIAFYDSDHASLQTNLTWPFISKIYVPRAYTAATPARKTTRIPGTKELSYFHPSHFTADKGKAVANGIDPDQDNFLLRIVSWNANHDLGKSGWTPELLRAVSNRLAVRGKVIISSETPLPEDLRPFAYKGPKRDIHDVMAFCRMLVGESATMASEAAVMGVPSIFAGKDYCGYVVELEAAGLLRQIKEITSKEIFMGMDALLAEEPSNYQLRKDAYVNTSADWADAVISAIDLEISGT